VPHPASKNLQEKHTLKQSSSHQSWFSLSSIQGNKEDQGSNSKIKPLTGIISLGLWFLIYSSWIRRGDKQKLRKEEKVKTHNGEGGRKKVPLHNHNVPNSNLLI